MDDLRGKAERNPIPETRTVNGVAVLRYAATLRVTNLVSRDVRGSVGSEERQVLTTPPASLPWRVCAAQYGHQLGSANYVKASVAILRKQEGQARFGVSCDSCQLGY